jgi:hypothetical protein
MPSGKLAVGQSTVIPLLIILSYNNSRRFYHRFYHQSAPFVFLVFQVAALSNSPLCFGKIVSLNSQKPISGASNLSSPGICAGDTV